MAPSKTSAMPLAVGVAILLAAVAQAAVVTVCVPVTTANVGQCGTVLTTAAAAAGLTDTFTCISRPSGSACSAAVANGEAQLTKFGGDNLYISHKDFGLRPVAAETLTPAPGLAASPIPTVAYAAVAVVKQEACAKTDLTFSDFAGKTLCSTGYRRGAGWTLPMGYLIEKNIVPVVAREPAIEQDAESVASFFGRVCAHGVSNGPARNPVDNSGAEWDRLCTACSDPTCAATAAEEPYSDYPGALRCLTQGGGDIAFTKSETLLGDPSGWESATVKQADLRLLCPNRVGCQPLSAWKDCYIALSASHAFVATPEFIASPLGASTITFLSGITQTVINSTRTIDPALPNLLFTAGANGMSRIANPADFASHFTPEALAEFEAIRNLNVPTVRICTISAAEKATCDKAVPIMNRVNTGMQFSCVQAEGDTGCLNAIEDNLADMRAFDGGDIYQGYVNHNLQAIAAEKNPTSESAVGVDYYGVAVVKKSFCDLNGGNPTLADLKGKRACSTGYRRSAGWLNPMGALVGRGIMPVVRNDAGIEDDAESWVSFFSGGTCAARTSDNGPVNTPDGKGARWDPLCKNCKGDCNPSIDTEPYYDYAGALRCVMEDAGDVAFTKHTVALDFSRDGKSPAPWSTLLSTDLALLCPTGGCAPLAQAYRCNIAQAVAHAVMVRTNYPDAERLKAALRTISQDSAFRALIFSAANNPGNHLFKYITTEIVPVNSDRAVYLGENLKVYEGLDILSGGGNLPGAAPSLQASASSGDDSSSGLSTGAIVGIAIGAAVGGALLAVAIAFVVVRSRKSKFDQFKEQHSNSSPGAADSAKVPNF